MPTYQYKCKDCGNDLEVVQKFSDPSLTVCPACEGELRKVYNAVGVVFKGSGFYATDNRTKGSSNAASNASPSESSAAGSTPSADKPAVVAPASTSSSSSSSASSGSSSSSTSPAPAKAAAS